MGKNHEMKKLFLYYLAILFCSSFNESSRKFKPGSPSPPPKKKQHFSQYTFSVRIAIKLVFFLITNLLKSCKRFIDSLLIFTKTV